MGYVITLFDNRIYKFINYMFDVIEIIVCAKSRE